jgi:threonine dehydrogenase-like Zn-dependent dehydrogenase
MTTPAKVAFLGLGVMGYPMAGHLRNKGGHDVTVYNRTTAKTEKWAKQFGGSFASTPAEAVRDADFVFACVGNDTISFCDYWAGWRFLDHEEGRDFHRQYHRFCRGRPRTGR